ncbi:hypothetical protein [Streptomyces griseorubiginosus]|uniref:hypothetical protein n=1 Tax=Streptomyces griseorubiginosus TaxID=67304 RepID=UPI0033D43C84
MLAIAERVLGQDSRGDTLIWHKPVGRVVEEFQAIACSAEDGITLPPAKQNVPISLDKPGERWCRDCLALLRH